jgi:RNA polymerase sigma-54 factor
VKTSLHIGLNQSLKLTPQLTQAIRLLALSTLELETELTQLLESNPLLERPEDSAPDDAPEALGPDDAGEIKSDGDSAELDAGSGDAAEEVIDDSLDLDAFEESADWSEPRAAGDGGSGSGDDENSWESRTALPHDLRESLRRQIGLMRMSVRDRAIAEAIVDAIDSDGYLREPFESIQEAVRPTVVSHEEIEAVLRQVQQCEPTGVGARDLRECLLRQVEEHRDDPAYLLAKILVERHLEDLPKIDAERFAAKLVVSVEEFKLALGLIRSLNPRPGENVAADQDDYIVPDLIARKVNGRWRLQLSGSTVPALSINRYYERLASESRGEPAQYLKGQLQEARWLIKSLAQRGETLLKVGESIIREQGAFLDYGPAALRPLTLRQVAEEVGLHESTISRATTRKYMATPRGVFELKRFFSSGVATTEGGEASAIAIQSMIRKLIDAENIKKPLSDQALADQLRRDGIAVARRTVAKYREAMNIPSSSDRCRLA